MGYQYFPASVIHHSQASLEEEFRHITSSTVPQASSVSSFLFVSLEWIWELGVCWFRKIWVGLSPCPVTVTTRIIISLVGDPYKLSCATVTGRGDNPRYEEMEMSFLLIFRMVFSGSGSFGDRFEAKQKQGCARKGVFNTWKHVRKLGNPKMRWGRRYDQWTLMVITPLFCFLAFRSRWRRQPHVLKRKYCLELVSPYMFEGFWFQWKQSVNVYFGMPGVKVSRDNLLRILCFSLMDISYSHPTVCVSCQDLLFSFGESFGASSFWFVKGLPGITFRQVTPGMVGKMGRYDFASFRCPFRENCSINY